MPEHSSYTELFDEKGNLISVLIAPSLWEQIKPQCLKILGVSMTPKERPEPIADWETLIKYWDFNYPVDTDVFCATCGTSTKVWADDEPRKFRLSAATLGGLVTFTCQTCHSKILKKHFKDRIQVDCSPYTDKKNPSKEGRY